MFESMKLWYEYLESLQPKKVRLGNRTVMIDIKELNNPKSRGI